MYYKNKTQKIVELRQLIANAGSISLSSEDIECVNDNYQSALELSWYKDELRDEIENIKNMSYSKFDCIYNNLAPEAVEVYKPAYGDIICGDINEDEY